MKHEDQIAAETEGGREGLRIWQKLMREMPGEVKLRKAFELTEMTRRTMRSGIAAQHPEATEDERHEIYLERMMQFQGTTLTEVRRKMAENVGVQSSGCSTIHSHPPSNP